MRLPRPGTPGRRRGEGWPGSAVLSRLVGVGAGRVFLGRLGWLTGVVSVTVLGVAACGGHASMSTSPSAVAGSPVPSPAAARPTLPPRPGSLSLTEVEPCSLLAGPAATALGVGPGSPHGATAVGDAAECQWSTIAGQSPASIAARVLLHRGAALALAEPGVDKIVVVQGYPAVRTTAPGADPARECLFYVDVADGQSLLVEYLRGLNTASGRESACRGAQQAAQLMVQALQASPH